MVATSSTRDVDAFDLVVIGGGSGGVRAARIAAGHGARVAIIEKSRWGGTCVVRGCIPKKLFVYAAQYREAIAQAAAFGHRVTYHGHAFGALRDAVAGEINRLSGLYRANLEKAGVVLLEGEATCVDPHTVVVQSAGGALDAGGGDGTRTLRAKTLLLAVGGQPRRLAVPGGELIAVSDDFFTLPERPAHAVIIGGGYIAAEFASVLVALGSQVTMLVRSDAGLPGFDQAVSERVFAGLMRRGVEIRWRTEVLAVRRAGDGDGDGIVVRTTQGADIACSWVCAAIGRDPSVEGLGLEALGVRLDRGRHIVVNEWSQTNVPSVFAVGDCTGRVPLTPAAIREGHAFADSQFGGQARPTHHDVVTSAVFALPQAAGAGMTEAHARQTFGDAMTVYQTDFRPLASVLSSPGDAADRIYMKLIVEGRNERVIGAHMVGDGAAEIIQMAAIAIAAGLSKSAFDATMAIHPTSAEEFVLLKK